MQTIVSQKAFFKVLWSFYKCVRQEMRISTHLWSSWSLEHLCWMQEMRHVKCKDHKCGCFDRPTVYVLGSCYKVTCKFAAIVVSITYWGLKYLQMHKTRVITSVIWPWRPEVKMLKFWLLWLFLMLACSPPSRNFCFQRFRQIWLSGRMSSVPCTANC